MKVNEFIANFAKKTGVDEKDENLQLLLAASSLKDVEVPQELIDSINKGIYTKEAAKNDPEIGDHYASKYKQVTYGDRDWETSTS